MRTVQTKLPAPFIKSLHTPLEDEAIAKHCPSIFAAEPHASRSERYTYIPTSEILQSLRKEGFFPFSAAQSRTRDAEKREHTKHMVRLRHASTFGQGIKVGEDVNEIILVNSHDGTSSYQMMGGVFRFVCANGMAVGDKQFDYKVHHKGDVNGNIIEGCYEVVKKFDLLDHAKQEMKETNATIEQARSFFKAVAVVKFGEETEDNPHPFGYERLGSLRRKEDQNLTAWNTLNIAQENIIKGGIRYTTVGENGKRRRASTKAVTSINEDIKLNRALWTLAQEFTKQVKAA